MRARGFSTASSAPVPAAPLQCPGLDSFYSGRDAPKAKCSICSNKRRLHVSCVAASEAQAAAAPAQARAVAASQITLESNAVNASAEDGSEVPDLIARNQISEKVM